MAQLEVFLSSKTFKVRVNGEFTKCAKCNVCISQKYYTGCSECSELLFSRQFQIKSSILLKKFGEVCCPPTYIFTDIG